VLLLAVAGEVVVLAVAVVGVVAVGVEEPLSPGLLLVLVSVGLTGVAGVVVVGVGTGLAGSVGLASADDVERDGHTVTGTLLWGAEVTPWLTPPTGAPFWVADPFRLGTPPAVLELAVEVELELEIPTAEPSWTKAWRSGGSARTTPTANTAQAAARAGRSTPYRQSRCCRSPSSASRPPRSAFQRRTMPARKPPLAECLPARAGPELTRARIRSSPSGRGSI
jgi:hypothetical protein